MNQEEIRLILSQCCVGPMEKSLTSQLNDKKAVLVAEIAQYDAALKFLSTRDAERLLTEFMEAADKNYPN